MPKTQQIKYSLSGRPYVTHYNSRIYLDEVMRGSQTEDGGCYGTQSISNVFYYLVKLNSDNETAKVSIKKTY